MQQHLYCKIFGLNLLYEDSILYFKCRRGQKIFYEGLLSKYNKSFRTNFRMYNKLLWSDQVCVNMTQFRTLYKHVFLELYKINLSKIDL